MKIILRGFGQVMFQNNALTGLLFLAGIFYNSWLMGLGALLGNIVGILTAKFLKYSEEDIENGLYGFNGVLVGIAIWFFYKINIYSFLAIIIGAVLSTLLMRLLKIKIPALTAPFVISTWLLFIVLKLINQEMLVISPLAMADSVNLFSIVGKGLGEVMFQDNIITGLIFILGILINSRLSALYAVSGAVIGGLSAYVLSLPLAMINFGLFSFNAVLCGIALGDKKWSGFVFAYLAVILSVFIYLVMNKIGLITLTAPFVLATWAGLSIKKVTNK